MNPIREGWKRLHDINEDRLMPAYRVFIHPNRAVRVWFEGMATGEVLWWWASAGHPNHDPEERWWKCGTTIDQSVEFEVSAEEGKPFALLAWPHHLAWLKEQRLPLFGNQLKGS